MSIAEYTTSFQEIKRKSVLRKSKSSYQCSFCYETIKEGEIYYDRGFNRRIHKKCLDDYNDKP